MSRPRFLADHDLIDHIVSGVLRREPLIEFLRLRDLGMAAAGDSDVLEYAGNERLIVVSHDVGSMPAAAFERLAAGQTLAGLLLVRQRDSIAPIIESLVLVWAASEVEEWEGVVRFLPL
jgi:Domain of unknown function (DUF5615)